MNLTFDCDRFKKVKSGHLHIAEVATDIGVTGRYLTKSGQPWIPVMGEFHFSRFPCEQWEDEILKMKAGGITILSTYIFWIHHEEKEGAFNFTGDRDLHAFLSLCHRHKMLVLLRIGPWCHGEVVYGGFPAFIQERRDKRTNSPGYLEKVRRIYSKFYEQAADYFYQHDSVVIGIQLDNEYDGPDKDHIVVLRQLALDVGFVLPLYTQTAWPINTVASNKLLPMFGTYPEHPWDSSTKPLPTDNRFRIIDSRADEGIGSDILKPSKLGETTYDDFPFATCELGCGNQVTEHRRPIISADFTFHGLTFRYITAQPICAVREGGIEKLYLFTPDGVACTFEAHGEFETQTGRSGEKYALATYDESKPVIAFTNGGNRCEVYILSQKTALNL